MYYVTCFNRSLVYSENEKDNKGDHKEMDQEEVFSTEDPSTRREIAEVTHPPGESSSVE